MSIDKLGSAAGIIAALRAEMSKRNERAGKQPGKRGDVPGLPSVPAGDIKALRKHLAELVKTVSADDPAAVRAARPQVVRAILLWEFGPALRDHPEWQPMLDSITQSLEANAPHEAQLIKLISDLKR